MYSKAIYSRSTMTKLVLGAAIGTIPIIFYYSSILYLEMPVVLLMFIVCIRIKELLELDFDKIRKNQSWYALILLGFIKETAIIFLISFLFCRLIMKLKPSALRKITFRKVRNELYIILCTLVPGSFYIFFRIYFNISRKFSFNLNNLFNIEAFLILLKSYLEQFGPIFLIFIGGCIVLLKRKEYGTILFFVITFITIPLFHLVDDIRYAGYSRFNLFLVPSLLAGSSIFIEFINNKKRVYLPILIFIILGINVAMAPVNIDGTKKPYWGNYLFDTSEHYYPYPETISWLKENYNTDMILFTGLDYPYYFDFYFDKLNWHPEYEMIKASDTEDNLSALYAGLKAATEKNAAIVVFQAAGNNVPAPDNLFGFHREKVFKNMAHSLVVYLKN